MTFVDRRRSEEEKIRRTMDAALEEARANLQRSSEEEAAVHAAAAVLREELPGEPMHSCVAMARAALSAAARARYS